jgi:hypothetical protein
VRETGSWLCGVSSVGDAGAVDKTASGAGCFTFSPSPSALFAFMLHGTLASKVDKRVLCREDTKVESVMCQVSCRMRCGLYVVSFS